MKLIIRTKYSVFLACLLIFFAAGCSTGNTTHLKPALHHTGPLYEFYTSNHSLADAEFIETQQQESDISTIAFETHDDSPHFTMLLCSSEQAFYCGYAYTDRLGCYRGLIWSPTFQKLAQAFEEIEFFELPSTYARLATDQPSSFFYVEKQGRQKIVRDFGNVGPRSLWTLGLALQMISEQIYWTKTTDEKIRLACPSATE